MNRKTDSDDLSFIAHLDELRGVLFRCLLAWAVGFLLCLCLRDTLFSLLFAPARTDFCLYRAFCRLADLTGWQGLCPSDFKAHFISTELTAQFMTHLQTALWGGLVVTAPYLLAQLYGFISPALYARERRFSVRFTIAAAALFLLGILVNYLLVFPLSFRFLATYQVQPDIPNHITLSSYISSFLVLSLLMGVMFELPIAAWFLARMDLLTVSAMRHYRKHALVAILIVAAIITPTGDAVTLLVVTCPIYLLYELSIGVVRWAHKKGQKA